MIIIITSMPILMKIDWEMRPWAARRRIQWNWQTDR